MEDQRLEVKLRDNSKHMVSLLSFKDKVKAVGSRTNVKR